MCVCDYHVCVPLSDCVFLSISVMMGDPHGAMVCMAGVAWWWDVAAVYGVCCMVMRHDVGIRCMGWWDHEHGMAD